MNKKIFILVLTSLTSQVFASEARKLREEAEATSPLLSETEKLIARLEAVKACMARRKSRPKGTKDSNECEQVLKESPIEYPFDEPSNDERSLCNLRAKLEELKKIQDLNSYRLRNFLNCAFDPGVYGRHRAGAPRHRGSSLNPFYPRPSTCTLPNFIVPPGVDVDIATPDDIMTPEIRTRVYGLATKLRAAEETPGLYVVFGSPMGRGRGPGSMRRDR